jgi:hypothetical protein
MGARASYPVAVAIAIRQQVDPAALLQRAIWQAQGWSLYKGPTVVRQVPLYSNGTPAVPVTVDAFEWVDAQLFGVGNADDGIQKLRAAIQQRGSDLYAYALLRREVVNVLGFHVWSYRLVVLHSFVQLLEWAVAILAIAFAAVIFIQYVTTGRAPALTDLQTFFAGLFKAAGDAGGTITSGLSTPFLVFMLAGGVAAIVFAQAQKGAGVSAGRLKQPGGSIGLKTGPLSTRVGT